MAELTRQWLTAFPPKGGINRTTNPLILSMEDLTVGDNIIYTSDLQRSQRPGQVAFQTRTGGHNLNFPQVKHVSEFWWRSSNTQTHNTIKIVGDTVSADITGDGNFAEITGTTSLTATDVFTSAVFGNRLILCSENAVPQTWTGSGNLTDLGGSPPNGSLCRAHMSRMWIAGVKASAHKIFFSQAFNPTVWSGVGTGALELDPDDNDPIGITAIFPSFFGELYVAKRNAIYQIKGITPHTFQVIPLITEIGCVSHNAVSRVQNDIIFPSHKGIHSLVATKQKTGVETDYISFKLHDLWQEEVNIRQARRFFSVWLTTLNSYVFGYASGTSNFPNNILVYNAILQAWSRWPNINISSITESFSGGGNRVLVGRNDGVVAELDSNKKISLNARTDIGGEIKPSLSVGPFYIGRAPNIDAGVKNISVSYSLSGSTTMEFSYKVDNFSTKSHTFKVGSVGTPLGANSFVLGLDRLGKEPNAQSSIKPLEGQGKSLTLSFTKNSGGTKLGSFSLGTTKLNSVNTFMHMQGFAVEVERVIEQQALTNI